MRILNFGIAILIVFTLVVSSSSGETTGQTDSAPAVKTSAAAVEPAATDVKAGTTTEEKPAAAAVAAMPKLIDFGSKQCKACKAMEPVLESLMKNHADKFVTEFVDVWVTQNQPRAKKIGISSIPTQVFFDADGKELFRHTGFISEDQVLSKWQELGITFDKETEINEADTAGSEKEAGAADKNAPDAAGGCCGGGSH